MAARLNTDLPAFSMQREDYQVLVQSVVWVAVCPNTKSCVEKLFGRVKEVEEIHNAYATSRPLFLFVSSLRIKPFCGPK